MRLIGRGDIRRRLAIALWGSAVLAVVLAAAALWLYQSLTLEQRAREVLDPYAQLVSVGVDAAVAFEDSARAQEVLESLLVNPHILAAEVILADGRTLARLAPGDNAITPWRSTSAGTHVFEDQVELMQYLPHRARLLIRMGLGQVNAQGQQALYGLLAVLLVLIAVTALQMTYLRRTLVRPIAALTDATDKVRVEADYRRRIPIPETDELARLGRGFNDMLSAIQAREGELRQLSDFQRSLLDNTPFAIVSCRADGIITSFNPAAERLLGYRSDEVIGHATPLLWHLGDELAQRAARLTEELGLPVSPGLSLFSALPATGVPEEAEWTYVRKDGSHVPVLLSVAALRDDSGAISGYIGITYDLSERRQAEAALRRVNRELLAISDCNEVLVRADSEPLLIDQICHVICEQAGYRMAWVGYATAERPCHIEPVAAAGNVAQPVDEALLQWSRTDPDTSPAVVAIVTGRAATLDDIASAPPTAPWRQAATRCGYGSALALPLKDAGAQILGVLNVFAAEADAFTPAEQRLLSEMADDLAYGIVTLRARVAHAAAEEQMQIAATAFEAQEGIIITDARQTILRVNRAFTDITGYTAEEVVGRTPHLLNSGHHDAGFFRAMWAQIHSDGFWQGEIWSRRKGGDLYPESLNITAVRNSAGQVTHYVGTMTDITQRKEAERQIEHLAFYDLLTGLPNRRLFVDRLQQAMAGSARSHRMGALLFIDLDNFKLVNDTCGHDIGDRLLTEVAHRLTTCVRDGDTISRLGGDEFVAMLEHLSESPQEAAAQARGVAGKILDHLNQPYTIAGRTHHSTPSIGATLFVGSSDSVDELLKQADIAMYQAKAAGRNTLRFFDPDMQSAVAARAALEADLRLAVNHEQFVLHFQPQVDAAGRIIGAEALLRWQHPARGLLGPGQFIPLAEETGLILGMGRWVLRQACRVLSDWAEGSGTTALQLAVNVSARQFRQPEFVAEVREAIADSGATAGLLKIELTESIVLDDVEDTIAKMAALKEFGVGFSMDDFGTGYSSLSYLTRLPLDQLKIDQSFVRNLPDSGTDAVVVQSIITLASSLGLSVIAEGVETAAQRTFLFEHGCPAYQGYVFSKPVPLEDFEALIGTAPS